MPKLPRITAVDLLRALQRDGWDIVRQRGTSHAVLRHPTKPGRLVIAIHPGKDIAAGTLNSIVKAAGLTPEALRDLL